MNNKDTPLNNKNENLNKKTLQNELKMPDSFMIGVELENCTCCEYPIDAKCVEFINNYNNMYGSYKVKGVKTEMIPVYKGYHELSAYFRTNVTFEKSNIPFPIENINIEYDSSQYSRAADDWDNEICSIM